MLDIDEVPVWMWLRFSAWFLPIFARFPSDLAAGRVNFWGAGGRRSDGRGQGGEEARERWGTRGGVLLKRLKGRRAFCPYGNFGLGFSPWKLSSLKSPFLHRLDEGKGKQLEDLWGRVSWESHIWSLLCLKKIKRNIDYIFFSGIFTEFLTHRTT